MLYVNYISIQLEKKCPSSIATQKSGDPNGVMSTCHGGRLSPILGGQGRGDLERERIKIDLFLRTLAEKRENRQLWRGI